MALDWLWWRAWVGFGAVDAAVVCVAGVALGDIERHFAWQAWLTHNLSTHNLSYTTCPRTTCPHTTCPHTACHHTTCSHTTCSHTTCHIQLVHAPLAHTLSHTTCSWRHGPSLCVAGVALMALDWLWWRAWVGFGAVDAAAVCVAGVALGDIERRFAWQAWHLATWTSTLRGRRGTYGIGLDLAPWTPPLFAGQAWHLATSSVALRGRRGTWRHGPPLCVAGVALMALDWLWWRAWVGFGAVDAAVVCVAGVALGDIERHFAWQAWLTHNLSTHNLSYTTCPRTTCPHTTCPHTACHHTTCSHTQLVHTQLHTQLVITQLALTQLVHTQLALGDMDLHGTYGTGLALVARLGWIWRRGRRRCLRGRRGTWRHRASLCMAGVALGDMDFHFAWQAWHLSH